MLKKERVCFYLRFLTAARFSLEGVLRLVTGPGLAVTAAGSVPVFKAAMAGLAAPAFNLAIPSSKRSAASKQRVDRLLGMGSEGAIKDCLRQYVCITFFSRSFPVRPGVITCHYFPLLYEQFSLAVRARVKTG
jgi:hypothetical protein